MEKPQELLTWIELVLDNRGDLCQMNRLPGENEVSRHQCVGPPKGSILKTKSASVPPQSLKSFFSQNQARS